MRDHGRIRLGVEVSREDHRAVAAQRVDALPEQCDAFAAGRFAFVVEVRVDEEEFPAVAAAPQHDPRGQPFAGAVPSLRPGASGFLAQPERARVEQVERPVAEEHRVELARADAVFAAHADGPVVGQRRAEVVELVGQQLLRSEQVGFPGTDQAGDAFAAEAPVVRTVFGIVVTHVERHDAERPRFGVAAGGRGAEGQQQEKSFHGRLFFIRRKDFRRESGRTPFHRALSSSTRVPVPRSPRNNAARRRAVPLRAPRGRSP